MLRNNKLNLAKIDKDTSFAVYNVLCAVYVYASNFKDVQTRTAVVRQLWSTIVDPKTGRNSYEPSGQVVSGVLKRTRACPLRELLVDLCAAVSPANYKVMAGTMEHEIVVDFPIMQLQQVKEGYKPLSKGLDQYLEKMQGRE